MSEDKWLLRPAIVENKTERGFIMRGWLETMRGSRETIDISNDVFYWHHHLLIEKLWERDGSIWQVACDPKVPAIIYGYMCGEATDAGPMLHWCFVKSRFRGQGICQDLLRELISRSPPGPLVFTSMGGALCDWRRKFAMKNPFIYNPYAKYYGLQTSWQTIGENHGTQALEDQANDLPQQHPAAENHKPQLEAK